MADSFLPRKKRSLFVKTYSKVRPLQTFVPDFPSHSKNTGDGTPTVQSDKGKLFPFIVPPASIAPTLAPANSPSSDSSSSETHDVEMISSEVEKPPTADEDEQTFVTLTPGSKKLSCSKKQSIKKSCNPLQNISNVIKVIHSSKPVSKRMGSPVMWTCTKVRPHGQLACIQESEQESSLSDGPEGTTDKPNTAAANKKAGVISNPSEDTPDIKMLDCQDMIGGVKRSHHLDSKARDKDSTMSVQGRGVFNSIYSTTQDDQRSTQLYGSTAGGDELSTVTYTRESEETSDESTLMTSDTCTDGRSSTDTLKDEDFSDIEIPRDFPGPTTRVMKQLTPKIAQLILPDAAVRTTPKKTVVSTTKAMPRKYLSAWHNKKATVVRAKNSTLLEGLSALNIQEYRPIEDISDIQEDNSRPDLVSSKITSTPTSKDRNTMVHQRFIPDVSSIEGDACVLPTIDAMQSLSSTILADNNEAVSTHAVAPAPTPRSVYSLSASSDSLSAPLSIKGRKALPLERASLRMSPRVSFGQYPTAATKSSSSVRKNTPLVSSAGNMSRNSNSSNSSSSSSSKHVKFLLANKAHEVLPEPDSNMSSTAVHLPELSPSSSILKKRDNTNAASEISRASKTKDPMKSDQTNKETSKTGRHRMTSTPQRSSRRTRGVHMLALSFDVSAVDLPSCSDDDLITQPSHQTEAKTVAKVANQKKATITTTGQSTHELMDFEVSTSITSELLHTARDTNEDKQTDTFLETDCTIHATPVITHSGTRDQDQPSGIQHPVHVTQAHQGTLHKVQYPVHGIHDQDRPKEAQHPVHGTPAWCGLPETQHPVHTTGDHQGSFQDTQHPVYATKAQGSLQEAQRPVHATPRAQLKRSSPNSDLPGRPKKKKFLEKGKSDSTMECTPQTCERATQKNFLRQQKRLEYVDKAVGPPECIISRLGPTLHKPARFWQYVNTDGLDYRRIKNMPQDILETIPDAVFS